MNLVMRSVEEGVPEEIMSDKTSDVASCLPSLAVSMWNLLAGTRRGMLIDNLHKEDRNGCMLVVLLKVKYNMEHAPFAGKQ
jgi:hypothetical protein